MTNLEYKVAQIFDRHSHSKYVHLDITSGIFSICSIYCLKCPNRAKTVPALARYYPQWSRTGLILALQAMFIGVIFLLPKYQTGVINAIPWIHMVVGYFW